jgi:hypothetical protein
MATLAQVPFEQLALTADHTPNVALIEPLFGTSKRQSLKEQTGGCNIVQLAASF